ncbi:unnamed protein product [Amoebophrya sp. A120]|nr:unnamed protein product [Amoebophrya sp. A120]|eukprot:GSA120T00024285001.1
MTDFLRNFGNSFTLLVGIALLLYGMRGALRSWRGTLKCRILMRAFGYFDLRERDQKLKEKIYKLKKETEQKKILGLFSRRVAARTMNAAADANGGRGFGPPRPVAAAGEDNHLFDNDELYFPTTNSAQLDHDANLNLPDSGIIMANGAYRTNGASSLLPPPDEHERLLHNDTSTRVLLEQIDEVADDHSSSGESTPGTDLPIIFQNQEFQQTERGRKLEHALKQEQALLNEEKAICIHNILSYGEVHMSEMMADLEETPSSVFKGTWLVACLLFMQVSFFEMHFLPPYLLTLVSAPCQEAGNGPDDTGAGAAAGQAAQDDACGQNQPAVFNPIVTFLRYTFDILRVFLLVGGLMFSVFIPRQKRKDYWAYDLPNDITDDEVKLLLRNRNVSFLTSDAWHGWAAGIAGFNGVVSFLCFCFIFDLWARCEIGWNQGIFEWVFERQMLVQRASFDVYVRSSGTVVIGEDKVKPNQAGPNIPLITQGIPPSFAHYNPIKYCDNLTNDGKFWYNSGFNNFIKCAPFLPNKNGDNFWTLTLFLRLFALICYIWCCASMMLKFRHVLVGNSSYYRGLRAEIAIVKIGAWEAAFIAIGVWYRPLGLNDYLLWGNMPWISLFLFLFVLFVLCLLLSGLVKSWTDLMVDFEYPHCSLTSKFDYSWRTYEKFLEKHLRGVQGTRREVLKSRGENEDFEELINLPPDELPVGQVLLYKTNPAYKTAGGAAFLRNSTAGRLSRIAFEDVEHEEQTHVEEEADVSHGHLPPNSVNNPASSFLTPPGAAAPLFPAHSSYTRPAARPSSIATSSPPESSTSQRLSATKTVGSTTSSMMGLRKRFHDQNPWLDRSVREAMIRTNSFGPRAGADVGRGSSMNVAESSGAPNSSSYNLRSYELQKYRTRINASQTSSA